MTLLGVKKLRPDWKIKTYVIPISRIETNDEFWMEARTLKNAKAIARSTKHCGTDIFSSANRAFPLNLQGFGVIPFSRWRRLSKKLRWSGNFPAQKIGSGD